jgi:RimJ/RimL family protein N-acetyltransferase
VVADNKRAIKVYEKVGFKKEGIARDAFYGDDHRYHDEVEMGLLL